MFESAYGEMKSEMLDHQQTFFRSVEESENKFNDAVINIAEQWVKQAQEGNLDAVSDELAAVRLVCWGGAMLKNSSRALLSSLQRTGTVCLGSSVDPMIHTWANSSPMYVSNVS